MEGGGRVSWVGTIIARTWPGIERRDLGISSTRPCGVIAIPLVIACTEINGNRVAVEGLSVFMRFNDDLPVLVCTRDHVRNGLFSPPFSQGNGGEHWKRLGDLILLGDDCLSDTLCSPSEWPHPKTLSFQAEEGRAKLFFQNGIFHHFKVLGSFSEGF